MRWKAVVVASVGVFASSCSVLPSLEEATGGIPVSEIVLRIKCELSNAFTDDRDIDRPNMSWLQNWTTQVDLTLEILDSATFAPGASFMQPLHNGFSTAAGPNSISTSGVPGTTLSGIAQSFAVSAGASLNGQTSRTQTLAFAVSLAELKRWRSSIDAPKLCAISDNMDLRGRLGLKEWVAQALQPVLPDKLLFAGYHPKPASSPGGSPAPSKSPGAVPTADHATSATASFRACAAEDQGIVDGYLNGLKQADATLLDSALVNVQGNIDRQGGASATELRAADVDFSKEEEALKKRIADSVRYIPVLEHQVAFDLDTLATYGAKAVKAHKALSSAAAKAMSDATKNAEAAAKTILATTDQIAGARSALTGLKDCSKLDLLGSAVRKAKEMASTAVDYAHDAQASAAAASQDIDKIKSLTKALTEYTDTFQTIDPPLSTIGQSVQFVLSYSGNATPTWTFVSFKGPNSPLFTASGTRTHMLNITLGPPTGSVSTANPAIAQNQLYLLLNNRLPGVGQ